MKRFFILGCQRSGTTLLKLVLEAHSRIYCYDEQRAYAALRNNTYDGSAGCDLVGYRIPRWTEQMNQERIQDVEHDVVCDFFYDGEPIVFMLRDVRDIVCSMMGLEMGDSNWWSVWGSRILKSKIKSPQFRERFNQELEVVGDVDVNGFGAASLYWKYKTVSYYDYLELGWPVYGLSYERFVRDPESELRKVLDFLKLDWDGRMLRHHLKEHHDLDDFGMAVGNTDPKRPIEAKSVGIWERSLDAAGVEAVYMVAGELNERLLKEFRPVELAKRQLSIPFDQYQRYRIVSDIINRYRNDGRKLKILEVGASFEQNLGKFLPDDDIFYSDIDYPKGYETKSNYIVGDIIKIDFQMEYDIVVSLDCYEHITPAYRDTYIRKLIELSQVATILSAPFDTPGVEKRDLLANELFKIEHGTDHKWLKEHIENGLPSLSHTTELIEKMGFKNYSVLPNAYLPRWFDMIAIYFLAEGRVEYSEFLRNLTEFYNRFFYSYDNCNPSYRKVIVVSKLVETPDFTDILSVYDETDPDFEAINGTFQFYLNKFRILYSTNTAILKDLKDTVKEKEGRIGSLEESLKGKETRIKELEVVLGDRDLAIKGKDARIRELEKAVGDREGRIGSLKESLKGKETRIKELEVVLGDRDLAIKGKDARIRELEKAVGDREARIQELEAALQNRQEVIVGKDAHIRNIEQLFREKEAYIEFIHSGHGWRLLTKYYRMLDKLLPPDTRRKNAMKWVRKLLGSMSGHNLRKSLFYIKAQGIFPFLKKARGKLNPASMESPMKAGTAETGGENTPGRLEAEPQDFLEEQEPHVSEKATISIVIPTLNAEADLVTLLPTLRNQRGLKSAEIIIVDSGSTDGTVAVAEEYRARVLRIAREEFSHSYARNLGATHATGNYLLFMTQDALPSSDFWLYEMLSAFDSGVAAVSCAEAPREDADLFYRVASWYHSRFLGIEGRDRVTTRPETETHVTLRKNGQLSDVACLIPRDVFLTYQFRNDYAEDLDLGIRLIRDGHSLALLGTTKVIHSHNRPPDYQLKRGYVDSLSLPGILPDFPVPPGRPDDLLKDAAFTFRAVDALAQKGLASVSLPCPMSDFIDLVQRKLAAARNGMSASSSLDTPYLDEECRAFLERYLPDAAPGGNSGAHDGVLFSAVRAFIGMTLEYLAQVYEAVDEHVLEEFKASLYKAYVNQLGARLAFHYLKNKGDQRLKSIHAELARGV